MTSPSPLPSDPPATLYLIDGSAYIHRAFHAIRDLTNSRGMPTNAVFGFTRILMRLIEERGPEYLAVVFDARGPTFRHRLFPAYKANRPPMAEALALQIPYIHRVTRGFRLPLIELAGYEADDLIGTLARQAQAAGYRVVVVSGDKDFLQLVSALITIWDPMKERSLDVTTIRADYDLAPAQMLDVQALQGDATDNIPGVPGIGPKTALELIRRFGRLEAVLDDPASAAGGKKKLQENLTRFREQALLSRTLAAIDTMAPIAFDPEALRRQAPDSEALSALFGELEFRQLQQQFAVPIVARERRYSAILTEAALDELVGRLTAAPLFSLDSETTAIDPMRARLVGLSFAVAADEAWYIPVGHQAPGTPSQLPLALVLERLRTLLEDPARPKVGQNIKYDWLVLQRHGVALAGAVFDTMLASYLINPAKRAHNLDQIALDFLNHRTITYAEVAGKGKGALPFSHVALESAVPYACEDADVTLQAHAVLSRALDQAGLRPLLAEVEMPLVPVLVRMELAGIGVDRERLALLSSNFASQIDQIEGQVHTLAGESFNLNSSQQLGRILFEKLGLPVQKKTRKKTAYSTDVDVLTELAAHHELPALLLRHRTLSKLKSTYADALGELIHPETGRIHTSFNQTVAATGRLSSSDPNLQNIPIRTAEGREIRRAFISRPGWHLLSADYSQIELRVLAHCAEDSILCASFAQDEDIHARTAAEIFGVPAEAVGADLRRQAKTINFGIIYGMSPFGLSKALGISQKMARTFIEQYFARYPGVRRFLDHTIAEARRTGHSSTLLGRTRPLPEIDSDNLVLRQAAERTAINTPIQGTAADLIKMAMIRVDAELQRRRLQTLLLLSVHDELVFEVPPAELETVVALVRESMETVVDLLVPLKVNVAWGGNWDEAH